MENTIIFESEEKKWDYKIVPCLECPIYPLRKEWENEPDIRKDKCYTSRCTYNRKLSKEIADDFHFMLNNYYCEECDKWFPKDEFGHCPNCETNLAF